MIKFTKKHGKNGVEVIRFNGKKWLNEKYIEIQLGHSALRNITNHYSPHLRKKRRITELR